MRLLFLLVCLGIFSYSMASDNLKEFKKLAYVYIPSGSYLQGESTFSTGSFFIAQHEVTNFEYLEFISDLQLQNRLEELQLALPDTNAWNMKGTYLNSYADYYFRHPAYFNYPVVNVSAEAVELYCRWLQEKLKTKYGSDLIEQVRLPDSHEWTYAAAGGFDHQPYSWGDPLLRDKNGNYRANFKVIGDEFITRNDSLLTIADGFGYQNIAGILSDNAVITAPSESYEPNNYGLYNMCGNVSELVRDMAMNADLSVTEHGYVAMGGSWNSPGYDIRITSKTAFEKANPFVGFRPVVIVKIPEK